jgi:hypothetical protein
VEEVVLELLDFELVLLLVLLRELELEVKVVDDKVLPVEDELGPVCRDTVVGVDNMTSVIPEMTVVRPDNENSEFTGMVASPVKMTSVTPLITVTNPGTEAICPVEVGSWEIVAEVITRNGVPLIVVVMPLRPGGAFESGISVALGTTRNGVPLIVVVNKCPVWVACTWTLVAPGTAIKGVLLIIVRLPLNPVQQVSMFNLTRPRASWEFMRDAWSEGRCGGLQKSV